VSYYRQLVKQGGKEVTSEVEVTEAEPNRRVATFSGGQLRKTASRYEAALAERLGGTAGK